MLDQRARFRSERVHFVGIGGIGMEALARFLDAVGCKVSGSDREASATTDKLRQDGIDARVGHDSANVRGVELVVYSAAVPLDNVELNSARQHGIELVSRAQLLGQLSSSKSCLAVAGTHGKTTTASMLAAVLRAARLDPSIIVGGWVDGKAQATAGSGSHFVVEADEFDRSFLHLDPQVAVVTNMEAEHLGGSYRNLDDLLSAFTEFLHRLPAQDGRAVVNGDDPGASRLARLIERSTLTFGFSAESDVNATDVQLQRDGSCCTLRVDGAAVGQLKLSIPGVHNVSNAMAAAAAALCLQVPFEAIRDGLAAFRGVDRRFQILGEVNGILVVDDYAHHPTEVRAALAAARGVGRRVIAVFQPHLYSRTRLFSAGFADALRAADVVLLAPVYGSREEPEVGINSELIAEAMRSGGFDAVWCVGLEDLTSRLRAVAGDGDLIITLGAGNIGEVADAFVANLN